ncbi:MAG: hypothetical protein U1A78_19100 [Polyangia bacterium]
MTSQKQKKRNERKERLRIQKHTAPPRRPYKPHRPGASYRDSIDHILANLERDVLLAEERMKREERFFDAIREMQAVCRRPNGEPMLLQEPDGRLTPLPELKARFPGYHDIILPPRNPDEVEPETETKPITEDCPPIVEFPVDGHPGWRIAMVPPSRINFVEPAEPIEEDEDAY